MCIKLGLSQLIFTILTIGYVKRFSSTSTIIRLSQLFSISLGIDDVMNYAIKADTIHEYIWHSITVYIRRSKTYRMRPEQTLTKQKA